MLSDERNTVKQILQKHLVTSEDWAKLKIKTIQDVSIVKMPGGVKLQPKLGIEISPSKDDGSPLKKRNIYITNLEYFKTLLQIFSNHEKLLEIMNMINEINNFQDKNQTQDIIDFTIND
jgi:hypothetical protein